MLVVLLGADLPANIPIPEPRPDSRPLPKAQTDGAVARPELRPDDKAGPRVDGQDKVRATEPDEAKEKPAAETYVPPPIEKEDPQKLRACLAELDALGVGYKPLPAITDGNGCGVDRPFEVTSLASQVGLNPPGKMRCETALQLTRWIADVVIPMLKTARPGDTLVGLDQASAYVCRKRNGAATGKISEHAHGNAVDIAGFRFKSGNTFSIKPRMQDSTLDGAFQRAVTAAACLYFTTVLDPGSDKAHETHLHLDVIARKAGFRYCW